MVVAVKIYVKPVDISIIYLDDRKKAYVIIIIESHLMDACAHMTMQE